MTARYEVRGSTAVVTLDNPPVNGLGHATRQALAEAIDRAEDDAAVRAIVLTGAGKAFSGGADIKEFQTPKASAEPTLHTLIRIAEASPKPVIAAIHTVCMGGGLEFSLACHFRVAAPGAQIALPEVKLGLLPGAGGTQRMAALCGAPVAKRLILGAETARGTEAVALGLAQWSAPAAQLAGFAQEKVAALATLPAAALAACKRCIDLASPPQPAGYLKELAETRRLYGSEPTRTLVQQFISKRKS
jgi:enoyl-CoA hydratase/carnithine racemase